MGFTWMKKMAAIAICAQLTVSCSSESPRSSDVKVTDIYDSAIKWQSIGNCWIYSTLGWVESLLLKDGQGEKDFSESYLTYRYYQEQLKSGAQKIQTGGFWSTSQDLILAYGLMLEGDFIPEEKDQPKSLRQAEATAFIEEKLADQEFLSSLALLTQTEKATAIEELLNEAFGVEIELLEEKIIPASAVILSSEPGKATTLSDVVRTWRPETHKSFFDWYSSGLSIDTLPAVSSLPASVRKVQLERKVMKALNKKIPVQLVWFVDFNAQGEDGIFSLANLKERGVGSQGYHQTVIEDYAVEILDPLTGEVIREIGEGQASQEDMLAAETNGRIKYLVVKNSWGGSERLDRPSYVVNGKGGYARLEADYLFGWMIQSAEDGGEGHPVTGFARYILPDSSIVNF